MWLDANPLPFVDQRIDSGFRYFSWFCTVTTGVGKASAFLALNNEYNFGSAIFATASAMIRFRQDCAVHGSALSLRSRSKD